MYTIHAGNIVEILQKLDREVADGEMAVLRVSPEDPVAWESFPTRPTCTVPGIHAGQMTDERYSIADGRQGLHVQRFAEGYIDIHLDDADCCRSPLEHLLEDTKVLKGAAIGGLAALVLGALTGSGKITAGLVAVSTGIGAAAGAHVPRRRRKVILLCDLLPAG
jgi:hypothetical protein